MMIQYAKTRFIQVVNNNPALQQFIANNFPNCKITKVKKIYDIDDNSAFYLVNFSGDKVNVYVTVWQVSKVTYYAEMANAQFCKGAFNISDTEHSFELNYSPANKVKFDKQMQKVQKQNGRTIEKQNNMLERNKWNRF